MRRRIRSATFPLHRHSLPQLVVDGVLVAAAYQLAFLLRFDTGVKGYYSELLERTWPWVVAGMLIVLALSGVYQRRWRYAGQRDFEAILRAVVISTVALVVAVTVLRPVERFDVGRTVGHGARAAAVTHPPAQAAAGARAPTGGTATGGAPAAGAATVGSPPPSPATVAHTDTQTVAQSSVRTASHVARVARATTVTHSVHTPAVAVGLPNGVIALFFLMALAFLSGARLLAHTIHERGRHGFRPAKGARDVLIVGAGDGGRLVLREVLRNRGLGLNPVGFLDDDPTLQRMRVDAVRVLGRTGDLPRILDEAEPDEVIIAIPSAPGTLRADVVRACRERGIAVRMLPTVFELLQGGPNYVSQVREVRVEDVLGREPVVMELDRVGSYLNGAVVLVTGAGGSIGAELCRQIARVAPRRLVLLDHAEDNLFLIQRELEDDRHVHPSLLAAVLADCKEEERMREVVAEHRPTVIFHAAAYKHVGLMEANPVEAVRNNALATRVVATVAGEQGVETFVLVSTDKAVAPATVMGASKALAECAVEAATARYPETRYTAVRFGNVLGSSNSVVPIFRRQIANGGPVTVTDDRMTRYFMTIPEAVQLVIQSGKLGRGGEIFVLEMGDPVSIMQLARDMIELSGLDPDRDIAIELIGRRPGEKLSEDLFNPYERRQPTPAERIVLAEREPLAAATVEAMFDEISLLVLEGDAAGLAAKVSELSSVRSATPASPDAAGAEPAAWQT